MVTQAILDSKKRNGVSRQAIGKYILANYKVEESVLKIQLKLALKRMTEEKEGKPAALEPVKGSFKLAKNYRESVKRNMKKKGSKETKEKKDKKEKKAKKESKPKKEKKEKSEDSPKKSPSKSKSKSKSPSKSPKKSPRKSSSKSPSPRKSPKGKGKKSS